MSTGPSMQSVGALPTDTSPWAVHQPAAQAVCRLGSVLCEAAPLGSGPSDVRPHTRCDQFTTRMPALGPTRPISQNEWTSGKSGAILRQQRKGPCGCACEESLLS